MVQHLCSLSTYVQVDICLLPYPFHPRLVRGMESRFYISPNAYREWFCYTYRVSICGSVSVLRMMTVSHLLCFSQNLSALPHKPYCLARCLLYTIPPSGYVQHLSLEILSSPTSQSITCRSGPFGLLTTFFLNSFSWLLSASIYSQKYRKHNETNTQIT